MCSISGIFSFTGNSPNIKSLTKMNNSLTHRGPDNRGIWFKDRIALAHNRLSILDLSKNGEQPMTSQSKNKVIVFNGEIYNWKEIKNKIYKIKWKSKSDTEVLIEAYEKYGLNFFDYLNGIFSFAIYDIRKKELLIARDRLGVKPIYWTVKNQQFIFSSEIKGLLAYGIKKEPCKKTLKDFLFNGLIDHSEKTLFKNIYQLEPGNFLKIKSNGEIQKKNYWNLKDRVNQTSEILKDKSKDYIFEKYRELLNSSLNLELRSDVELGTTLSSGFDSSMLTYMIKKKINNFSTFSYGFNNEKDETFYAKKVSDSLKLNNFSVKLDENELEEYLNKVVLSQESPVTSIRVLAMHKMYEKVKERGIKVILEGQGGDELGAGYEYYYAPLFLDILKSSNNYSESFIKIEKILKNYKAINSQNKYKRLFDSLMYVMRPGIATQDGVPFVNHDVYHKSFSDLKNDYLIKHELDSFVQSMQLIDIQKVILPRGLRFVDRASMASSVEARVPLLDHRITEFSLSVPTNLKINENETRYFMKSFFKNKKDINFKNKVLEQKKTIVDPQKKWLKLDKNNFVKDLFNTSELYEDYEIFDKKKLLKEYSNFKNDKNSETSFHIFQYVNVINWLKVFF